MRGAFPSGNLEFQNSFRGSRPARAVSRKSVARLRPQMRGAPPKYGGDTFPPARGAGAGAGALFDILAQTAPPAGDFACPKMPENARSDRIVSTRPPS